MTTLRQAVQEYVRMRRDLGFTLHEAGKGLLDFVTFMEQHRASSITQALALAWARQPSNVQPAHWARRLSFVRAVWQRCPGTTRSGIYQREPLTTRSTRFRERESRRPKRTLA